MNRFQNILAAIDSESSNNIIVSRAATLAKQNGARLKLVGVVRELGWLSRFAKSQQKEVESRLHDELEATLQGFAKSIQFEDVDVSTAVLKGKSSFEIVREVLRDDHDLVVKLAKGNRGSYGFFGTTGMRLLRTCPCPVWLINPETNEHQKRVVAAVDPSSDDSLHVELNRTILDLATSLRDQRHCQLDIVHAWNLYGESLLRSHVEEREFQDLMTQSLGEAEDGLDQLLRPYGMDHDSDNVHLLHGDAGLKIPEFVDQNKTSLLVMGTVARSGIAGAVMGNTAEMTLGKIQCSTLAIKPSGFVSPIQLESKLAAESR